MTFIECSLSVHWVFIEFAWIWLNLIELYWFWLVCGFAAIEFSLTFHWFVYHNTYLVVFGCIAVRGSFVKCIFDWLFLSNKFRTIGWENSFSTKFPVFSDKILLIFVIFHLFPVSGCGSFSFYRQVCFKSFLTVKVPCSEVPVVPRTAWKTFLGCLRCDPKFSSF